MKQCPMKQCPKCGYKERTYVPNLSKLKDIVNNELSSKTKWMLSAYRKKNNVNIYDLEKIILSLVGIESDKAIEKAFEVCNGKNVGAAYFKAVLTKFDEEYKKSSSTNIKNIIVKRGEKIE